MWERMVPVPGGEVWCGGFDGGDGIPLVCLHGGPGFPHDYISNLSELRNTREVIFYDQLGCGRSDRPTDPGLWTLERSLVELNEVLEVAGTQQYHLFGSSWGGFLAIEHALAKPPGLTSLVLGSPLVSVPRWSQDSADLVEQLPAHTRENIQRHEKSGYFDCPEYGKAVLSFWKKHVCRLDPFPDEVERSFSGMGTDVYRSMWGPSEFTQSGNLKGRDASCHLETIDVPVLWTCGRYDEARPKTIEYFNSLTKRSEVVVFEKSAHMAHLEETDEYLDTVREFLSRVERGDI